MTMDKDLKNSPELLKAAIKAVSSESESALKSTSPSPSAVTPNADLRSVLNELAGKDHDATSHRALRPQVTADKLKPLIREATSESANLGATSKAAAAPPHSDNENLGRAVHDTYAVAHTDKSSITTSKSTLLRTALFATFIFALLGGAFLWWSPPQLTGPANTLNEITKDVERYRSVHPGELPNELAGLASFPKGAIEWPLRYWNARDAMGRTEIIWVPQRTNHYRIVVRQGDEVWTTNDQDVKPKLAMKGNPSHD